MKTLPTLSFNVIIHTHVYNVSLSLVTFSYKTRIIWCEFVFKYGIYLSQPKTCVIVYTFVRCIFFQTSGFDQHLLLHLAYLPWQIVITHNPWHWSNLIQKTNQHFDSTCVRDDIIIHDHYTWFLGGNKCRLGIKKEKCFE